MAIVKLILIALILFILSFNSYFTEWREVPVEFGTVMKEDPNLVLALSGWFVMAFSLLHLYPIVLNNLLNRIFLKDILFFLLYLLLYEKALHVILSFLK